MVVAPQDYPASSFEGDQYERRGHLNKKRHKKANNKLVCNLKLPKYCISNNSSQEILLAVNGRLYRRLEAKGNLVHVCACGQFKTVIIQNTQ
jgi:hypothetical protein